MRRHRGWSAATLMLVVALTGCALATRESLDWNVGTFYPVAKERTGLRDVRGDWTVTVIYARRGETAANWTHKLEVTELPIAITFMNPGVRWNPESVLDATRTMQQKRGCSEPWAVLEKDATSILYERRDIRCAQYLHRYEIGRIVMGRWSLWVIAHGVREPAPSADERARLIETLRTAKVIAE